ncbi:MAG TPA: hypothetical protein VK524_08570 [Polyangiaceae bacterium]|nr:hypothetical protein [Polyangiaceae bacterium]
MVLPWIARSGRLLALASACVCAFSLGCAEERDPINKVQANALEKRFFVGKDLQSAGDDPEFYTAMTVIDVPFGADQDAGVFAGLLGELYRVKWEITEDVLNARLTYEMIEASDGHGARTTNNGRVIASYKIESHFDVKRAYNSTTGEELNVVEENTTDRPWHQRGFFRVDWSKNLIDSSWWDPLAQTSSLGASFDTESVAYYVDDPESPDAPHFSAKDGYFDFVNKLYLRPKTSTVDGQKVVSCAWRGAFVSDGSHPWGNCENSEITVRVSFKHVAQPGEAGFTDYSPIDWDGARMNAFGMFWKDRLGWDDHYGVVDHKWRRFASRHNIWKASHAQDASGAYIRCNAPELANNGADPNTDQHPACVATDGSISGPPDDSGACPRGQTLTTAPDGTDDQCAAAGAGSQCDVLVGQCTIPYAKREVKPVVWRYTVGPNDPVIYDSTRLASWEWDTAMRIAVHTARRVECARTSGQSLVGTRWEGQPCNEAFPVEQRDNAELEKVSAVRRCWDENGYGAAECQPPESERNTVAAAEPVVVLCANPVTAKDDPVCGKPGLRVRPGDLRYHHVMLWPTRQSSSPWGYGPSLADPLTGEIVSVGINIYDSVTNTTAQTVVDTSLWLNGELSSDRITSGSYVRDWVAATNVPEISAASWPSMTKAEADRRVMGVVGVSPQRFQELLTQRPAFDPKPLKNLALSLHATRVPLDMPGRNNRAEVDARIALLKGTPIEGQLMNPMWLELAGVAPTTQVNDAVLDVASPLRGMNSNSIMDREHKVEQALLKAGQCMLAAPEPTGLPTFAKLLRKKFPPQGNTPAENAARIEKMWNFVRSRLNYSVILHEMGHTFGLTHNFVGSYDKFNYRPQYWQLRTKGGTVQNRCTGEPNQGDCIGPRYLDPPDQEELDGSIFTWMNTTVMDYPGDLTQDMLGLGVYDYAAARMFYGDVVDVRNDGRFPAAAVNSAGRDISGTGTSEGEAIKGMVDFAGGVFGQIVDVNSEVIHHTEYDKFFKMLWNCRKVTPQQPSYWNEERNGKWDAVLDGQIVRNEVCDRAPVEYVAWRDLIPDRLAIFGDPKYFIPRRGKDRAGRPRMPYGMEIDWYADGGSPPAYRHDAGADMYEEMVFHSSLYEARHIFDNFRTGRSTFSIYGAYSRALSRYHSKVASLTGGFSFAVDFILRQFAKENGIPFEEAVTTNVNGLMYDHAVAASLGFDHFARVLMRPQAGPHFKMPEDEIVRSSKDLFVDPDPIYNVVTIPNGTSMAVDGSLLLGGRPVNNELNYGNGAWNADYLNQVGSYYEKALALELMLAASHDTINLYRFDAIDARPRHISYANLYPDGMRRMIGMLLTEDYGLISQRISTRDGVPETVADPRDPLTSYPARSLGWVSWVPKDGPEVCWANSSKLACRDTLGGPVASDPAEGSLPLEPQWGWEMQKFVVLWAYLYLPSSEVWDWADLMRLYRAGADLDPGFPASERVEFRDPESGVRYMARRYGNEAILGKTYDKGVAAKMLQWANQLTAKAYMLDPTTPYDPVTGAANVVTDPVTRAPTVRPDPFITPSQPGGTVRCDDNTACVQLRYYRGLLDYTRDVASRLGFGPQRIGL